MGVPKYGGTVYDSQDTFRRWKVNIDDFLYTHDLFGFADGSETEPEKPLLAKSITPTTATALPRQATPLSEGETLSSPISPTPISSTEDLATYKAEMLAWEKATKKFKQNRYATMMNLRLGVADSKQDSVLHLDDPKKIYDTLVASGIDSNTQTLMQLMRALFSLKDQKLQSWEWKRQKLVDLKTQINNIESRINLPNIFLAYILVMAIPNDDYNASVDILLEKPTLDLDTVYNMFRRKERELDDPDVLKGEDPCNGDSVLVVRDSNEGGGRRPNWRANSRAPPGPDNTCSQCQSPGHFKKSCPEFSATKEGKAWSKTEQGVEYGRKFGQKKEVKKEVAKTVRTYEEDTSSGNESETFSSCSSYPRERAISASVKSKSKSFNLRNPSKGFYPKHWLIDSACSHHISPRKDLFIEGSLKACDVEVTVANDDVEFAKSRGDVRIFWSCQGAARTSILRDVYHIPGINSNLVSLGQFDTNGGNFKKVPGVGMRLENSKGELFLDAVKKDNLYRVKIRKESASTANARTNPRFTKSQRLHARLGHPGRNRLSDFEKIVNGIEKGALKDHFCEHCEIGKNHRRPSKIPMRTVSVLLECLHVDVYGPTEKSILGNRYMMTITDQYSKMIWVFFTKDKKKFIEIFETWLIAREHECAHRHNNERLQRVRLDRGREIWNDKLIRLGEKRGFRSGRSWTSR